MIVFRETKEDTLSVPPLSAELISVTVALTRGSVDWSLVSFFEGDEELSVCETNVELIWEGKEVDLKLAVSVPCPDISEDDKISDEGFVVVRILFEDCVPVPFVVKSETDDGFPPVDDEETVLEEVFPVIAKVDFKEVSDSKFDILLLDGTGVEVN